MSDKLPLELREARLNALLAARAGVFPCEVLLPGGIAGGRAHAAAKIPFHERAQLEAMIADAKARLIDDGILIHYRSDGSAQLLDRDFADPINGPLALEARRRRGWLGDYRGWLRGFAGASR